eukprot:CAMPEP_0176429406 /NCGR_PEP_ID=MMETSP0127-20121128/13695_1 /TAXON_ID=938130 /ORGANISM="Platyophrya macrostoma, Strain WH" /LENGTH=283 /DNA_ID=CAMNT_0017811211 /DNA_START=960 /DNA_END=1811 /DNA_ORIENTATION=-
MKKRMYYSVYHKELNMKIVAIDTNVCAVWNWFLLENPTDPAGMLEWLKAELYDAENKNQFVYIIGHIPTGTDCLYEWAARYQTLVDRFSYTIRGQFFGHTHYDQFQVFYGVENKSEPVGLQLVAPSLTTFVDSYLNQTVHPSIRLIEMDVDTGLPLNLYQYRLNLTKYNNLGPVDNVEWDLAYDLLSEYNLTDMSPNSMHLLREKIINDASIANKITKNYFANENAFISNTTELYCQVLSTDLEQDACRNGRTLEQQKLGLVEWLSGPWIQKIQNETALLVTI